MNRQPDKPLRNPLESVTADVIQQANRALDKAIRKAFIDRRIPLNTKFSIEPVSDLDDYDEPITREVTVHQVFPVRREFTLIREILTVNVDMEGAKLQQDITLIDDEYEKASPTV